LSVKAGRDPETIRAAQARSLCTAFSQRPLTFEGVIEATDALHEGPWSEGELVMLTTRLSEVADTGRSSFSTQGGVARKPQHMAHPEDAFTARDVEDFQKEDATANSIAWTMSRRLHRLGITCASVPLLKRLGAIVRILKYGGRCTNASTDASSDVPEGP
jgi:hypothetical protein